MLTSILHGIADQLSNNNLLPADAMTLVTNTLTQCSTQKFVSFIKFMHHEHSIGSRQFTIDDMLTRAEICYDELVKSNQWMAMTTTLQSNAETGFKVEHKDIKCFHCHKKGHIARNCPDKPVEDTGHGSGRGRSGRGRHSGCTGQGRGG